MCILVHTYTHTYPGNSTWLLPTNVCNSRYKLEICRVCSFTVSITRCKISSARSRETRPWALMPWREVRMGDVDDVCVCIAAVLRPPPSPSGLPSVVVEEEGGMMELRRRSCLFTRIERGDHRWRNVQRVVTRSMAFLSVRQMMHKLVRVPIDGFMYVCMCACMLVRNCWPLSAGAFSVRSATFYTLY